MGFFGSVVTSVIKVALIPVAVVKDAASVVIGVTPNSTKKLLDSAAKDVKDAFNDIT